MKRTLTLEEKLLKLIKKTKKHTEKHTAIALVITFIFLTASQLITHPKMVEAKRDDKATFTATFVGDIMLARNTEIPAKKYGYDYMFQYVRPFFSYSDYVTGNFEQAVVLGGQCPKPVNAIPLKADIEAVKTVKKANFTVVNLANNHSMDYQAKGLKDTLSAMHQTGLDYVGAGKNLKDAERISYHKINGITVATLGFGYSYAWSKSRANPGREGILYADPRIFLPLVEEADRNADLVVVHMHWGNEYFPRANQTQKNMAKALSDAGADVIVGHHPHVLQPIEFYKGSIIFYSLGNFIFDQGWSRTRESALAQLKIYKDSSVGLEITPMMIYGAQPRPVQGPLGWYRRYRIVHQLTKNIPDNIKYSYSVEEDKLVFNVGKFDISRGILSDEQ